MKLTENKVKAWYKSKTIWVGALETIAALSAFGYEFFTEHQAIDDPIKVTMFINGLALIILRLVTDQGIKASG